MKKFTRKETLAIAKKYNINLNIIDYDEFHAGMNIDGINVEAELK